MTRTYSERWTFMLTLALMGLVTASSACSSDSQDDADTPDSDADGDVDADGDSDTDADADGDTDSDADGDTDSDADGDAEVVRYDSRQVHSSDRLPEVRGWATRRGIIHAHSPYSHDACDGEPFADGVRNEVCFEDLRAGMCSTKQDFVFLTDHDDNFAEHEFPDVLLYVDGDRLIERGGQPVANRVICGDGHEVIVAAGSETGTMPIGLEHHVGDTIEERYQAYDDVSEAGVRALQDAGALVFLQHTEGWPVETILGLPIDGIEIYNLHQNTMDNLGMIATLLIELGDDPERAPDVELALLGFFQESEADLYRWSRAVAHRPMPGIIATDVHQNALPGEAPDGERLDSFRRMMHWFSNYLLVSQAGEIDDAALKEAIGHGRLYCGFDYLGYPTGFDFYARSGDSVYEMGDLIPVGETVELHLAVPEITDFDPQLPRPLITGRLLKAGDDGTWEEIASGEEELTQSVGQGVFRAEIRMTPEHLRSSLGRLADDFVVDTLWVYSNPIYVGMSY